LTGGYDNKLVLTDLQVGWLFELLIGCVILLTSFFSGFI
jgi:hypothetical protein